LNLRSSHIEEHQVGVLDELLHADGEASDGRAIKDPMVSRDAKVN